MTVTARSDEPIHHVRFEWHGCGIFGSAIGIHASGGWTSTVTPSETGEVTVVVRFVEVSGGEQTLEARGLVDFRHPG
jgi:hypothetical protein